MISTELTEDVLKQIKEIGDQQLGIGWIFEKRLENRVIFYDIEDGEVRGFITGEIIGPFGELEIIATSKRFERKGVAKGLIVRLLDYFRKKNLDKVVCIAWKTEDGGVHLEYILTLFGFVKIKEIKNFYYQFSLTNNLKCPVCGEPPCQCHSVLFEKVLNETMYLSL